MIYTAAHLRRHFSPDEMNQRRVRMTKNDLVQWIIDKSADAMMLTISKPHCKARALQIEAWHMEPIVSQIVSLTNRYVFGKHKRAESLTGMVVIEHVPLDPHFTLFFSDQLLARLRHSNASWGKWQRSSATMTLRLILTIHFFPAAIASTCSDPAMTDLSAHRKRIQSSVVT